MESLLTSLLADIMREKKTTQPAKAYSYLRFSTPEQMSGDSFRRQSDLAKRYAHTHGLVLDDQLTYHDLGVSGYSGANAQRGKLAEFLEAVENGVVPRGSFLLVESLDRISRQNPYDALGVLQRIIDKGITLVTLMGEPKVYNSETVRRNMMALMEFLLIATRAHEESATKQRRAKEAWKAAIAKAGKGESRGASACPSWIRATSDGKSWELIPERVAVVRRIFEMAKQGVGKDSIAERLNLDGVPPFNGGKQWWGSYIFRVLNNRAAVGEHTPREKVVDTESGKITRTPLKPIKDYYPAAVPKRLWDDVAALQKNNPRRGRHAAKEVANVFGGIARCPCCGATMTRVSKGNTSRAWPYLVCTSAKAGVKDAGGQSVCVYRSVGYGRVEDAFLDGVSELIDNAPQPSAKGRAIAKERRNLEGSMMAAESEIERLLTALNKANGARPAAVVQRIQEIERARAETKAKLDNLNTEEAGLDRTMVAARLSELKTAARNLTNAKAEERQDAGNYRTTINTLLRRLLNGVVVDYTTGVLRFQWRHSDEESQLVFAFPSDETEGAGK